MTALAVVLVPIAAVVIIARIAGAGNQGAVPESYVYDASPYAKIDPALVSYALRDSIQLKIASPAAMTPGAADTVYVGGKRAHRDRGHPRQNLPSGAS